MLDTRDIIYVLRLIAGASRVDAAGALPYYIGGPFYRFVMSLSNLHSAVERAFCMPGDTAMNITEEITKRFWLKVDTSGDCWVWVASKSYGRIVVDGRLIHAHRVSWMIHNGEIPNGLFVCHKCDNPRCVRPDHLFLGTHGDNMRDMAAKGRLNSMQGPWLRGPRPADQVWRWQRGEIHHNSKVTVEIVRQIRDMAQQGYGNAHIGRVFGIGRTTVRHIVSRNTWKHVN